MSVKTLLLLFQKLLVQWRYEPHGDIVLLNRLLQTKNDDLCDRRHRGKASARSSRQAEGVACEEAGGQQDSCVLEKEEEGKGEPASWGGGVRVSIWPEMGWQEMLQDEAHIYHGVGGTGVAQRKNTEICESSAMNLQQ